ncbi:SdpI family protein [Arthrobacter sp. ATA002]|uniref:SdpI family protein n=1 Tax=Arthrobacter sp. ATA002 TaxID=2991715 RepID=UPI003FA4330C
MTLSWVAEATARGKLGPNSFVGIRVGYVTHSPEAWTAGHRAARWPIHGAAAIFAACGILILALDIPEEVAGRIVIGASWPSWWRFFWRPKRQAAPLNSLLCEMRTAPASTLPHGVAVRQPDLRCSRRRRATRAAARRNSTARRGQERSGQER